MKKLMMALAVFCLVFINTSYASIAQDPRNELIKQIAELINSIQFIYDESIVDKNNEISTASLEKLESIKAGLEAHRNDLAKLAEIKNDYDALQSQIDEQTRRAQTALGQKKSWWKRLTGKE